MKSFAFDTEKNDQPLDLAQIARGLCHSGFISSNDLDAILGSPRNAKQSQQHPLEFISSFECINQSTPSKTLDLETLTQWLAQYANQPYYFIDPLKVDVTAVTQVMSYAFAQRHKILVVEVLTDEVVIASAEPFISEWEAGIRHVVKKQIRRVIANPVDIHRYQIEFYTLSRSVAKAFGENKTSQGSMGLSNLEQMLELGSKRSPDANDEHIVNIVDWLLQYAFDQRASDIHIEPRRELGHIRFRIDGILHKVYEMPLQVANAVTSRLKILGRMNVAEKRKPQDGRLKTIGADGGEVELRLATLPTAFGEKMVLRIFSPDVLIKSYLELGITEDDYQRWQHMTEQPNGIILVTGPTGSGKTTTLYSTLRHLAQPEVNVCTVEDPIELVEPSLNQMQVQSNIDLTFASGVRALLRQDPDIIMIGEIRDRETAEMAIQAALTGHLVFSTLHTNDAPSAITRLLELGVPAYLLKATLLGVLAQRLVRTLCPVCKDTAEVDLAAWSDMIKPWRLNPPEKVYRPVGCLDCRDTGYKGRVGIYEILVLNKTMKDSISEQCDISQLKLLACKQDMRTLRLSGALKVRNGETTIEEVLRVSPAYHDH